MTDDTTMILLCCFITTLLIYPGHFHGFTAVSHGNEGYDMLKPNTIMTLVSSLMGTVVALGDHINMVLPVTF